MCGVYPKTAAWDNSDCIILAKRSYFNLLLVPDMRDFPDTLLCRVGVQ